MKWTKERCKQLYELAFILDVAGSLDNRNNITKWIAKLEESCKNLQEAGFYSFLNELAIEERAKHATSSPRSDG